MKVIYCDKYWIELYNNKINKIQKQKKDISIMKFNCAMEDNKIREFIIKDLDKEIIRLQNELDNVLKNNLILH